MSGAFGLSNIDEITRLEWFGFCGLSLSSANKKTVLELSRNTPRVLSVQSGLSTKRTLT